MAKYFIMVLSEIERFIPLVAEKTKSFWQQGKAARAASSSSSSLRPSILAREERMWRKRRL